jgi:hypothetical protein
MVSVHGWLIPLILGLWQGRNITIEVHDRRKHSFHGNWEVEREWGQGKDVLSLLPSMRPIYHELTNGLIHY